VKISIVYSCVLQVADCAVFTCYISLSYAIAFCHAAMFQPPVAKATTAFL